MDRHLEKTGEVTLLDHLEDLRWHLIRSTLAVFLCGLVAFFAKRLIFDVLLFGPTHVDFLTYEVLCKLSSGFCFESDMPFSVQSRTMGGQFSVHIWTSITAGFILAFPYILYELWNFVSPALHTQERKLASGFIFISSLLFFVGVVFGYFLVAPLSINFLGRYHVSGQVLNEFDIDSYIGLVRSSVIACGLIFELPIVIFFLTKIGMVNPGGLKKYRKFALVGVLIISAIITPPDLLSQILVAIPVLILYEISILISGWVLTKQTRNRSSQSTQ